MIYARAYGIRATVIRLTNVFGPRACIKSADFTFNNFFIGLALQDRDITVYGDGKQLRNVLYVDDAVEALVQVAEAQKAEGETFFAAGDAHWSVAQIAEATVKHIGSGRVKYVPWPQERKAVDIGDAVISNKKLKDILSWRPGNDLKTGLVKTRKYYGRCLQKYL